MKRGTKPNKLVELTTARLGVTSTAVGPLDRAVTPRAAGTRSAFVPQSHRLLLHESRQRSVFG